MIKPGFEARAYQEINRLIDEGEAILNSCSLENFTRNDGAAARQNAIEAWLAKTEQQTMEVLIDAGNATPFRLAQLGEAIGALQPQTPSAAQLRHAFVDFITARLKLLNAMIGREAEN